MLKIKQGHVYSFSKVYTVIPQTTFSKVYAVNPQTTFSKVYTVNPQTTFSKVYTVNPQTTLSRIVCSLRNNKICPSKGNRKKFKFYFLYNST